MRAAAGIRMVVDAQMSDLVRKATIERGHDPRDFALLAYGGAGPLHAASYGREIGVTRLVVPLTATVYSAWGAAASDLRHTFKDSFAFNLPGDPAIPGTRYDNLERQARELLRRQDVDESDIAIARWAEVRYRRQMHEVRIPVPAGTIDSSTLEAIGTAFEARYEALYGQGTAYREAGIEIVTLELTPSAGPNGLRSPDSSRPAQSSRRPGGRVGPCIGPSLVEPSKPPCTTDLGLSRRWGSTVRQSSRCRARPWSFRTATTLRSTTFSTS